MGCPARAGMDPAGFRDRRRGRRLPRESGDGPTTAQCRKLLSGAAPRERGWTEEIGRKVQNSHGCPARAGMDLHPRHDRGRHRGLPRESGDGPPGRSTRTGRCGAAPRERGWTLGTGMGNTHVFGCPARAGMDPTTMPAASTLLRLPRESGDGPSSTSPGSTGRWAAPRERGWTLGRHVVRRAVRGCPARAGMDPPRGGQGPQSPGLPRESGDGPRPAIAS